MVDFFYEFPDKTNLKEVREGLNKNSEQLEQGFNYVPVEWFGLSVNNSDIDNSKAMFDAMASMHSNGHGLQFGVGEYKFVDEWTETGYNDFFALRGISPVSKNSDFKTIITRTSNKPLFTINGVSLTNMHTGARCEDIQFNGSDFSTDLIRLFSCISMRWNNVRFFGTTGIGLHMWEAMDSRFTNCIFEFLGDSAGTLPAVMLRSQTYDAGYGSQTREFTNQIHMLGCRFESYRGIAVQTAGGNTNNIFINMCKFESGQSNTKHLIFDNANVIQIDNTVVTQRGTSGSITSVIEFNLGSLHKFDGFIECTGTTGICDVESVIDITDTYGTYINLKSSSLNNRITNDHLINISNTSGADTDLDLKVQQYIGSTKKPFNENVVYETNYYSNIRQVADGVLEFIFKKTDSVLENFWDFKIDGDGDYSKLTILIDKEGVQTPVITFPSSGIVQIEDLLFIKDRLRFNGLSSAPAGATFGEEYLDSENNAKRTFTATGWQRMTMMSAEPTSGSWSDGDIIWNASPTAGGYVGWVCITSGTAGVDAVFKGFGLIEV